MTKKDFDKLVIFPKICYTVKWRCNWHGSRIKKITGYFRKLPGYVKGRTWDKKLSYRCLISVKKVEEN